MLYPLLFAIVFLRLIVLSVQQVNVNNWLEAWQRERRKVLKFINEACWDKNPQ